MHQARRGVLDWIGCALPGASTRMSDSAIEAKFLANAAPVVGAERAREIAACVWRLEALADVRTLVALAR